MGERGFRLGIIGLGVLASVLGGATRPAWAQTVHVFTAPTAAPTATGVPAASPRPTPADMPTARPAKACPPGTVRVGEEDRDCSAFGECCKPVGGKSPAQH